MTLTYAADTAATPASAWRLLSRPAEWHRWAPHLRGAVGMGEPEVRAGARGDALLGGVIPIRGSIVAKLRGRSWSWQVGPVRVDHVVEPRPGGARVLIRLSASRPLEAILAVTYGPMVALLVRRLARVAEERE